MLILTSSTVGMNRWFVTLFFMIPWNQSRNTVESFLPSPSIREIIQPLFWSHQVEVTKTSTTSSSDEDGQSVTFVGSSLSNQELSSPRKWLEYYEANDGQEGAYTVIRCDYYPASTNPQQWRIWGLNFHKERLITSFQSLTGVEVDPPSDQDVENVKREVLDHALTDTENSISTLLEAVRNEWTEKEHDERLSGEHSHAFVTLMLTVLWTKISSGSGHIQVRTHGFHSGRLEVAEDYHPNSITAFVACTDYSSEWPNRYQHLPHVKRSSWCRRRTPLEDQFKKPWTIQERREEKKDATSDKDDDHFVTVVDVGEVLLTRRVSREDEFEVLEGLTSNIFVIYNDGTLRTPPKDRVLGGYARQVVLDCAKDCGWKVLEEGPILLSESSLWKEIFLTSSIRIISPVDRMLIQGDVALGGEGEEGKIAKVLWKKSSKNLDKEPVWKQLYGKIMHTIGDDAKLRSST